MNVLVIIGDHPRNLGLLKKLSKQKNITIGGLILFKREEMIPKPPLYLKNKVKKLWKVHFEKRNNSEKKFFNSDNSVIDSILNKIVINNEKKFSSLEVINFIKNSKFQACFITGVPIIKDPLLSLLPANTVNLHLGLIPNYKGAVTMFWPFYFLEPTMAGTTYHIIDRYVDTGEILHNNVPILKKGDGIHDVACKAILSAHKDLPKVIKEIKKRLKYKIKPNKDYTLRYKGKLFRKSDWKPEMLNLIYDVFNDKIVDLYLNKKIYCKKPKLIKLY